MVVQSAHSRLSFLGSGLDLAVQSSEMRRVGGSQGGKDKHFFSLHSLILVIYNVFFFKSVTDDYTTQFKLC